MKVIITDNIKRIDLTVTSIMHSSDDVPIPIPEESSLSLVYDETIISSTEVEQMLKDESFKSDKRLLLLPISEADKFKTVFNVTEKY